MLLQGAQLLLKFPQGLEHDGGRGQRTGCFNGEKELALALVDANGFVELLLLGVLDALVAQVALHDVFNLNSLAQAVEREHFTGTRVDKLLFFLWVELADLFLIQIHDWLRAHHAGGHGRPLGVRQGSAFARNQLEVQLLVLTKLHDKDWVQFFASQVVDVSHRQHLVRIALTRLELDVVGGDFTLIKVRRTLLLKDIPD